MELNHEQLSELINIAIASVKINSLKTPYTKIRPMLHVFIYGNIGSGKSSILHNISDNTGQMPLMSLTKATVMGAVDKTTGMFTPPAVWEARNSVLLLDEFNIHKDDKAKREVLDTLLSLLENPRYSKKIGFRCNATQEKDGELYCIVDSNNTISCKTKFSLICNTMIDLRHPRMEQMEALKTRCLVLPHFPSLKQLQEIARGQPIYTYKEIIPPEPDVQISEEIYDLIINKVNEKKIDPTFYLRTIGDLCRVYAVTQKVDYLWDLVCDLANDVNWNHIN